MSDVPSLPDPGHARSFWLEEALRHDPGPPCPPLDRHVTADVCIVGGGFTGLWTAIELARREPGIRIALLEADICGGGASGRNGGFLSSSWWDLSGIVGLFGELEGARYASVLSDAIGQIGELCRDRAIDAWFHADGTLATRTARWQEGLARGGTAAMAARLGFADRLVSLSAAQVRAYADSPRFVGGTFMRDGATVQPARLARGLRRVALEMGVRIFERTEVARVDRSRRPGIVEVPGGGVKADQVVLAMGAWGASWPEFRRSFAVIVDTMVVTEPIPDRLRDIGWSSHVGLVDGRDMLFYLRRTDDDRIAIGGGTTGVVWGGRLGRRVTHDRHAAEVAARGLLWMFPSLAGVRFTHAWGGPIDETPTFLPFFKTLPPGNVHAGLGFSGHGLAQTMVGGRILASLALGLDDEWTSLPVVGPEIAKAPAEPFRWPAVRTAVWALEHGDAEEDAGFPRGRMQAAIGAVPEANRDRLIRRAGRRRARGRRRSAAQ